jgi:hypothetical protein
MLLINSIIEQPMWNVEIASHNDRGGVYSGLEVNLARQVVCWCVNRLL